MAIQAVRRSRGRGTPAAREQTESISIEGLEEDSIEALFDDYVYDGQLKYVGSFDYRENDPWTGEEIENSGAITFRQESGLVIIEVESGTPDADRIVDELSKNINGSTVIEPIAPDREQIWEFIDSADTYLNIDLIVDGYVSSIDDLDVGADQAREENFSIKRADLIFRNDDYEIPVRYHDQELVIDHEEPIAEEYVIQKYEMAVCQE